MVTYQVAPGTTGAARDLSQRDLGGRATIGFHATLGGLPSAILAARTSAASCSNSSRVGFLGALEKPNVTYPPFGDSPLYELSRPPRGAAMSDSDM